MAEHELEFRLRAAARALDANAPGFDPAVLRAARRRRIPRTVVVFAALVALVGVAAAPAAVSGLRHLFEVEKVPELGPVEPDVTSPLPLFEARQVPVDAIQAAAPFRVRMISSLGPPDAAYVRDDIAGGMVTIAYRGGQILLTQWRPTDVHARIAVVPVSGTADDVKVGRLPGLWIAGAARGTFTLVGADKAVHRERFEVSPGVLLWSQDGVAFLLQGASSKATAVQLAAEDQVRAAP